MFGTLVTLFMLAHPRTLACSCGQHEPAKLDPHLVLERRYPTNLAIGAPIRTDNQDTTLPPLSGVSEGERRGEGRYASSMAMVIHSAILPSPGLVGPPSPLRLSLTNT